VGANGGGGNGGGGGTSPTPEPAFFVPLVAGIGAMIGVKARKRRQGLAIESL